MAQIDPPRRRPRVFNTPFETGLRSVIILTTCYPDRLNLHRLVVFNHLVVHTGDIHGPESMHPRDRSRAAEILVSRGLVASGLALMETRGLVARSPTPDGFRYQAGEEAGSFVDLLSTPYTEALKERAYWLADNILPLTDDALADLVRGRMDEWEPEFQADQRPAF
jgi:ABC-3C biological conflict system middle component